MCWILACADSEEKKPLTSQLIPHNLLFPEIQSFILQV